mmetsp:Transcript_48793/g.113099  ORF Transcript_48793/g.113099 Transcript_48793/m.113099 type:complete len:270 (-) Transcript_48793:207-1016(-)
MVEAFTPRQIEMVTAIQRHWRVLAAEKDQPIVRLFVFRGVRKIRGKKVSNLDPVADAAAKQFMDEQCAGDVLLYTGHVGLSLDGGRQIFAWDPIWPPGVPIPQSMETLKHEVIFPGILGDDTETFRKAMLYHLRHGWNTRVSVVKLHVTKEKLEECKAKVSELFAQKQGEHGLKYSFPLRQPTGGSKCGWFKDDQTMNCASFPRAHLGLELPDISGHMVDFHKKSRAMELEQAAVDTLVWDEPKKHHGVVEEEMVPCPGATCCILSFRH